MQQHRVTTRKTGRYFVLGKPGRGVRTVIFACHGYAQLANDFLSVFGPMEGETVLVVAPEGLHRFYTRGTSGKIGASWMTKEDREDDIKDYVAFLDKVYTEVMKKIPVNAHVIALGFSQGAATVSRWMATGRSRVDEVMLWCGFFPPDVGPDAIPEHIKLTLVTASDDQYISPEEGKEQVEKMKELAPHLEHIHFEGKHVIDIPTLKGLLKEPPTEE